MTRFIGIAILLVALIAGGVGYLAGSARLLAPRPAVASSACQTFPQTGKTVCGRFLEYWQANGGLAQQGFPLSDEFDERSDTNGKTYHVQYFERAVFELHPENQPPHDVLLSLLGREKYLAKYPSPSAAPPSPASLVGQSITFPAFKDGTLRGTVYRVEDNVSFTPRGTPLVPQGRFLILFMHVSNPGTKVASVSHVGSFVLADNRNREFSMATEEASDEAGARYALGGVYDDVQPGLTRDLVFVFDVAVDAQGLRLVAVAP